MNDRQFMPSASRLLHIFTPSFADESDTNAQNLTVKEVVSRLDPQRFRVTMFVDKEADPRLANRPNTTLWKWEKSGNTLKNLIRLVKNVPDVYFFPREGPLDERFLQLRRWLGMRTAIVTYIVSGGLERGARAGQLRNLHAADGVYGNSRYITGLLGELDFPAETIYDGVDRRYFYPAAMRANSRRLTVLYAGSFRPYKRADLVVSQALRWPEVEFRLCGRGEEEEGCRKLAGDAPSVHFLGHIGQAELGEEMRAADLFFFPSELEGQPQVLLQAAASGLPCIARSSYRPDSVVDGKSGFLAKNDAELAQKLECLIKDQSLRERMSKAAVEYSKQFDWDKSAADWAHAFEKAVRKRG